MSARPDCEPVGVMIEMLQAAGAFIASVPYGEQPWIDAASDDDRRWFEEHPGAVRRFRPPYPGEFPPEMYGPGVREVVAVEVTQLAPGARFRHALTAREQS